MNGLLQDLRYAVRQLFKSPASRSPPSCRFTLGIGATTAIFSVVYSILLDPYPYRDADRMVHVELRDKSDRGPLLFVNGSEYEELRRAASVDDVFLQTTRVADFNQRAISDFSDCGPVFRQPVRIHGRSAAAWTRLHASRCTRR